MSKNIRSLIVVWVSSANFGIGCASRPEIKEPVAREVPQETVSRLSFYQEQSRPLPQLVQEGAYPLNLDSGQVIDSHIRGWDLDRDGRPEMIEIWGKNGNLIMRAVDIDGRAGPESIR